MQKVKKYLAVSVLLLALPLIAFIGTHFVLESGKSIYNYIPQESDVVIEINTRNFVSEIMYQRIYHEAYFHEKIVRDEHADPYEDVGFDMFSSVIIFREQWSESNMWMALIGYTNKDRFTAFLTEELPEVNYCFGDEYVLVQLTPYHEQARIDEHMKNIMNGDVKSFKERVDLTELFDRSKEINCYITPQNNDQGNQLLNGNLSLDFLGDEIEVSGEFTPVSGFSENEPIAYAVNNEAPFSLRSSLDIFNSIYWFSEDNIKGIPQYSQMAFDYNGMNLFMVHKNLGYMFPFKQYPDMQLHLDIVDYPHWRHYFDTLQAQKVFKVDTVTNILSTSMGTYFIYEFNENEFELMRSEMNLSPNEDKTLYFAFHMNVMPVLDNIKLAVDEENPPAEIEQKLGLVVVEESLAELRVMANIEDILFELRLEDETRMVADGKIRMLNRSGNSIIESMSFGSAAVLFMANYLSTPGTAE
ncbi:MAG: hypothetical protein HYZ14_18905 [Bacteroidetes bacterium]|nr:hypothetical protein [Bacteroidota bacterium]